MYRLTGFLLFSHMLLSPCGVNSAGVSYKPEEKFLWLEYGKQLKNKDGSVVQVLLVRDNGGSKSFNSLSSRGKFKAIYRVDRKNNYSLPLYFDRGRAELRIKSGKTSFFEVRLTACLDGALYSAETSFYLFGKADYLIKRDKLKDIPEHFPIISMHFSADNYWPQTGREYRFKVNSHTGYIPEIKAIDKKNILSLDLHHSGEFTYTPSHDRDLDKQGSGAYKGSVIYMKEEGGGRIFKRTYTLLLHRSRSAYHDLTSGLFLLSGSIAFFLSLVILARMRKFRMGA